jgi:glycosyl hydrolase family 39 (putative alpha-L-iduronidase)
MVGSVIGDQASHAGKERFMMVGPALLVTSLLWAQASPPNAPRGSEFPRWRFKKTSDAACARPDYDDAGWETVGQGHSWRSKNEPAWLRTTVAIPEMIDGKPTAGEPVGLRLSVGDLAEIHVGGHLQERCDNDHPGMALLSDGTGSQKIAVVAVRAWPGSGGEGEVKLNEAVLCLIDRKRVREPFKIRVDAARALGPMPRVFSGLSQGGGMCDYEPATAKKLREAGVRWFRMDNVLTNVLKAPKGGGPPEEDWTDFDRRVDFINAAGAEPILCLSYMPQPLDQVANNDRHSVPRDFKLWEDLCFKAARRAIDRGKRVKYWEVWNETNSGWLDPGPGKDRLEAYLNLYDASACGVRRADAEAWIGGPANASGPWNRSPERGYCVDGEKFLRGLLDHSEKTGTPLDFISWHEYFQPPWIFKEEVQATRAYLKDYPKTAKSVKELFITEWNYAWWPDPAQDCELGAAWCADIALRVFIPLGVDKPCFFYVKDGDENFRGSYAMLMGPGNRPKAAYNVMKEFGMMAPERIACEAAEDGELTAVASRDPATGRITVLVVHYPQRFGVERKVEISFENLPKTLEGGTVNHYLVDALHSNAFQDRNRAELERVRHMPLLVNPEPEVLNMLPSSVALIEIVVRP